MTARASALVLLAAVSAAGAQSTREVRLDVGAAQVQQTGRDARDEAGVFGLSWSGGSPLFAALFSAGATFAGDSTSAAQAGLAAAWRASERSAWQTEGGMSVAAFGASILARGGSFSGFLRERVSIDAGGAWVGGAFGGTSRDDIASHSTSVERRRVVAPGRFRGVGIGEPLAIRRSRAARGGRNFSPGRRRAATTLRISRRSCDISTVRCCSTRPKLSGTASRATSTSQSAFYMTAVWTFTPRYSLAVGTGRALADPIRGVPDMQITSASIRVALVAPRPPASARAESDTRGIAFAMLTPKSSGALLVVHIVADDTSRVELAGTFSDWKPVPLTRTNAGWEAEIALPPGRHRVAVRVNGGAVAGAARDGAGEGRVWRRGGADRRSVAAHCAADFTAAGPTGLRAPARTYSSWVPIPDSPMTTRRNFVRGLAGAGIALPVMRGDAFGQLFKADAIAGNRPAAELADDEAYWSQIQSAFDIDRTMINLNNGGCSPAPTHVLEQMIRDEHFVNELPVENMWRTLEPRMESTRRDLARDFGCDPEEIAVVRNATEANETVIFGMNLKAGDEVISTNQNYPRMTTSWQQRVRRDGIVFKEISFKVPPPSDAYLVEQFRKAITPRTKVIEVTHITNLTGQIMPVRDIVRMARPLGIEVLVDGAHASAAGRFPGAESSVGARSWTRPGGWSSNPIPCSSRWYNWTKRVRAQRRVRPASAWGRCPRCSNGCSRSRRCRGNPPRPRRMKGRERASGSTPSRSNRSVPSSRCRAREC